MPLTLLDVAFWLPTGNLPDYEDASTASLERRQPPVNRLINSPPIRSTLVPEW